MDHRHSTAEIKIRRLTSENVPALRSLMQVFGEAFDEISTYAEHPPGTAYLERLLASDYFFALVALKSDQVVGGLTAYELRKFEQERSEFYIYDLAVAEPYRRLGIATALIHELKRVAAGRGAYVVFVQADVGDAPAIALYSSMGKREEVLHFDIAVDGNSGAA